jgi:acyl dehydratase
MKVSDPGVYGTADAAQPPVLFFEDFVLGNIILHGSVTLAEADIIRFAAEFDPQPMHTDPVVAQSVTGGLIASGWHTASLTMRLLVTGGNYRPAPGTLGLGIETLHWHCPVRPGDTLRVQVELLSKRLSKSRPEFGILTMRCTTVNQHEVAVQTMISSALVPCRLKGACTTA